MKLFAFMAARPLPFILAMPIICIVLIAVGWTRDDLIEEEVYNIWVPRGSSFYKDRQYAESVGKERSSTSIFSALAISRDGGNLFTGDRLEEIRARMEYSEGATVSVTVNESTND